jgi:D-alanyl-D-alanine carboxypeptidase
VRTFRGQSLSRRRRGHRQIVNFLIGAAVLIAGCSIVRTPSTQTASALKPIDQAALQSLVDATIKELLIPSAVVFLRTSQGEFTAASGTTQLGARNRPGADTHFRIAPNTKTMTAAVILQLTQEGKLRLSDPVSKYVPGVPNGENITIAQLLEMRSGLYNYTNDPIISETVDTDAAKGLDPRRVTGNCIRASAQFPAGYKVRVQQHQLRAARPHHREGGW